MKKLPICKICKQRKVKQQEWKIEEEKEICLTCKTFKDFCNQFLEVLQSWADEKGIQRRVDIVLTEDERTKEDKLLEAITLKKRSQVIMLDKNNNKFIKI